MGRRKKERRVNDEELGIASAYPITPTYLALQRVATKHPRAHEAVIRRLLEAALKERPPLRPGMTAAEFEEHEKKYPAPPAMTHAEIEARDQKMIEDILKEAGGRGRRGNGN